MNDTSEICHGFRRLNCNTTARVQPCGWMDKSNYTSNSVVNNLDLVTYPILLTISTVGSVLTAFVLGRERPRTSKFVYLVGGAVFDMLFMWSQLPIYMRLNWEGLGLAKTWDHFLEPAAQPMTSLVEISNLMSNLSLVAFSINRLLAVLSPLRHRTTYNSVKNSIIVTGIIIVVSVPPSLPPVVEEEWCHKSWNKNRTEFCNAPVDPPSVIKVIMAIYNYSVVVIPVAVFLTILIVNTIIMRTLTRHRKRRLQEFEMSMRSGSSATVASERSALLMLAACVLLYFISNLPSVLINLLDRLHVNCLHLFTRQARSIWDPLSLFFQNINSSLSFILYCAIDPSFRAAFTKQTALLYSSMSTASRSQ